MTQEEAAYIDEVATWAQQTQAEFGVPASITIAQSILESSRAPLPGEPAGAGWGKSQLSLRANNRFGIKRSHADLSEPYVEFPTAEYVDGKKVVVPAEFAWYRSPAESFRAHGWLLAHEPRYAPAMQQNRSPQAFAHALMECGYSTNRPPLAKAPPYYADVLMDLVDEFNLRQYDAPPPDEPAKAA